MDVFLAPGLVLIGLIDYRNLEHQFVIRSRQVLDGPLQTWTFLTVPCVRARERTGKLGFRPHLSGSLTACLFTC